MKKHFLLFIFLMLCVALLPMLAHAASSGECGPALTWTLDDNGLLTVSGSGKMDSYYAFAFNDDVKKVILKDGVTTIGDCAFDSCTNLQSITIPNTVTSIGKEAFKQCTSLESVTIPNSVTFLGTGAFRECKALTSAVISNSLTIIRDKTFYYCNHLTEITIPSAVTSIGLQAFANCGRLTSVTVLNDAVAFDYWVFSDCASDLTIYCRSGSTAQKYAKDNDIGVVLLGENPTITTQPANKKVNEGTKATFNVTAIGADSYQWYYRTSSSGKWTTVKNGTSDTYTLTTKAKHNGYQFYCRVKNAAGSVKSNAVTLTVVPMPTPTITTQPSNKKVNEGAKATFKVVAANTDSYQWYYRTSSKGSWTALKNATSATYTLTAKAKHNGYQFMCRVKNSAGSVDSDIVTLTVKTKPVITTQPANQSVKAGAKATFKVVASYADSYQWYYQKPGATKWTAVSSKGTSPTYSLTTTAKHNGYKFKCVVKNAVDSVESRVVTLTVK